MRLIKGVIAVTPYLTVSVTTLFFAAAGEDLYFDINSNTSWVITDNVVWLSYIPDYSGSGNINMRVRATVNTGPLRTGTITITAGSIVRTIAVTQDAGDGS